MRQERSCEVSVFVVALTSVSFLYLLGSGWEDLIDGSLLRISKPRSEVTSARPKTGEAQIERR